MESPRNLPTPVSPGSPHAVRPVATVSPRVSPSLPASLPIQSPRTPRRGGEIGEIPGRVRQHPSENPTPSLLSSTFTREARPSKESHV